MTEWYNYTDGDVLDLDRKSPADFIDEIKMDYLRPYLPSNGVILEVGAGSGRLLTRIGLENNYTVIGIDQSQKSTKIIRTSQQKFNLNGASINGTAFQIPLKDNSIDVVCSGGLLEHFNRREIYIVLKEMNRVLKEDGFLYADIVPQKRSLCRPFIRKTAWGYENDYDNITWDYFLCRNGFKGIIFRGLVLPPDFYGRWTGKKRIQFMYKHKDFIKSLDNTFLSNWLGFAYFVFAKKR
ncbi:MAG: methyltransferase domain-containing protein [Methanosarcinaceae archaeon]|nr:methyltransferase domain-containing protein [Methanosarcinaceae archaeon]